MGLTMEQLMGIQALGGQQNVAPDAVPGAGGGLPPWANMLAYFAGGAGAALGGEGSIAASLGGMTQQHIRAQSQRDMLQQILAGGGDIKMTGDKTTMNLPAGQLGQMGQPSALKQSPQPNITGQQPAGTPAAAPTGVPLNQQFILDSLSNFSPSLPTGAGLVGLTAEDVNKALGLKLSQDELKRRTAADIAEMAFKKRALDVRSEQFAAGLDIEVSELELAQDKFGLDKFETRRRLEALDDELDIKRVDSQRTFDLGLARIRSEARRLDISEDALGLDEDKFTYQQGQDDITNTFKLSEALDRLKNAKIDRELKTEQTKATTAGVGTEERRTKIAEGAAIETKKTERAGRVLTRSQTKKNLQEIKVSIKEHDFTSPIPVPGVGTIDLDSWKSMPKDVQAYSYYVYDAQLHNEGSMSFDDWKAQSPRGVTESLVKEAMRDSKFKETLLEVRRAGATKISLGEQLDIKRLGKFKDPEYMRKVKDTLMDSGHISYGLDPSPAGIIADKKAEFDQVNSEIMRATSNQAVFADGPSGLGWYLEQPDGTVEFILSWSK